MPPVVGVVHGDGELAQDRVGAMVEGELVTV